MPLPSQSDPKLWLALLAEVEHAGGKGRPSEIYPRMRQYFPQITDADLKLKRETGENVWTNNIRWARMNLVHRGCIDNSSLGVWAITPIGKKWLQQEWHGVDSDYSHVMRTPVLAKRLPKGKAKSAASPAVQSSPPTLPTTTPIPISGNSSAAAVPAPVTPLPDPIEQLCQKLRTSQRQSHSPKSFEQNLTEAFSILGFGAEHIGGSGDTDIVINAAMGQARYSAIIDAKSTQSGRVSQAQISWPVIDGHRKTRGATFAAVIAEDFSGGQLKTFADQFNITLITTDMICELLKLHAVTPFNLQQLKFLFEQPGRADIGMQALRQLSDQDLRHWHLISEIVDTIETFQRTTPDGSPPKVDNLHFHLMLKHSPTPASAPTLEEVDAAVAFLASRAANILVSVPGSNGAYQLATPPSVARKRLLALARYFDKPSAISAALSIQAGQTIS